MQATPSYVFALRAMAAVVCGVTDTDRAELRALWQAMPPDVAGQAQAIVGSYYPGVSLPAALQQLINAVTDADHRLARTSPLPNVH
ncbi:hypothetical protein [Tepidimonas charontis]|uniref:Uncharacterized protein n=1 Tax=Tepidimonas charontis TaxID=2267262 RepID=A0A554X1M3_9BURK|nr:hypothetical protein [Tepidimonas charontis]TSE29666.1 hypothetical protein Tchar_02556 [Tepidimonas charontis]